MPKVYLETTIPGYPAGRPRRDLLVAAHQRSHGIGGGAAVSRHTQPR